MHSITRLTLALLASVSLVNCFLGTSKVQVAHSPLPAAANKRAVTIHVRQFTDSRKLEDKAQIGNKRNGFGMVLGHFAIKGGKSVAQEMTDYVADALRAAGYHVVVEGQGGGAGNLVLEGDVYEFWTDLYAAIWHNVGLDLKLKRAGAVAWQKRIDAKETNVLWLGLPGESRVVVREAIDSALKKAVKEFSSASFAAAAR